MWNIIQKYIVKKTVVVSRVHTRKHFSAFFFLKRQPSLEVFPETQEIGFLMRWVFGELFGIIDCQCKCRLNNQVTATASVGARYKSNFSLLSCEAICMLPVPALTGLHGAETRKTNPLVLRLLQIISYFHQGAFHQDTGQKSEELPTHICSVFPSYSFDLNRYWTRRSFRHIISVRALLSGCFKSQGILTAATWK